MSPNTEPTLTTRADPAFSSRSCRSRVNAIGPTTLVLKVNASAASSKLPSGPTSIIPALFTRTSSAPHSAVSRSTSPEPVGGFGDIGLNNEVPMAAIE